LLFGIPRPKTRLGPALYDDHGIVQQACAAISAPAPTLMVIHRCLHCASKPTNGHCGAIVERSGRRDVDNDDATLALLVKEAVSPRPRRRRHGRPLDMMDGRVGAIRRRPS
jgi:porphobilinogen synthase